MVDQMMKKLKEIFGWESKHAFLVRHARVAGFPWAVPNRTGRVRDHYGRNYEILQHGQIVRA